MECECCRRPANFVFTSKSEQVVCDGCAKHQGGSPSMEMRRHAEDVALWKRDVQAWRSHYEAKLAAARSENESMLLQLQTEITMRPKEIVERYVGQDLIDAAEQQRDAAFRSRDYAIRAICELDMLHHEQPGHVCVCGAQSAKCKEMAVVEEMRELLNRWKARQVDRLKRGQAHFLPDNHPAVIDPRQTA